MVERMETQQGSTDRSGWDAIRPSIADRPLACRALERTQAPSRFWYHTRWIIINIALIAALAYLYVFQIVPRITGTYYGRSAAIPVDVTPQLARPARLISPGIPEQSVQRLRREQMRVPLDAWYAKMRTAIDHGELRCVNGKTFIVHKGDSAKIEQTNDPCQTVDP